MAQSINVPTYQLYGEQQVWPTPDMVHCESIADRSRLHDWHIKPHKHNGLFQFLYLKRGTARVHLDGQETVMRAGQILIVPENYIHGFQFDFDAVGYVLTLAHPLIIRLTKAMEGGMAGLSHPCFHIVGNDEESDYLGATFDAFVREYRGNVLHRNLLVETLLATIVALLSRHLRHARILSQRRSQDNPHFTKFCSLMEEFYAKHYSLDHYANQIGITTAHLNLLCRRIAQKSALELLHERILLEAKRSMIYTSMTISEISYAIGFTDPAYFTRFFKRATGETPKNFRKKSINTILYQTF